MVCCHGVAVRWAYVTVALSALCERAAAVSRGSSSAILARLRDFYYINNLRHRPVYKTGVAI